MKSKKVFALVMIFLLVIIASSSDARLISKKTRKKWGKRLGEISEKIFTQDNVNRGVEAISHYVEDRGKAAPQTNVYVNNQSPQQTETQTQLYKTSTTDYPSEELAKSFKALAKKVLANNKPEYQIKLDKNELPKKAGTIYNRVCAKDKTIVAGTARENGKYKAFCMMTTDPDFIFTGGIRAGADVRTVENFFMARISDLAKEPGHVHFNADEDLEIDILYDGNTITQLGYYDTNSISCQRTGNFVHDSMRRMGFRDMY